MICHRAVDLLSNSIKIHSNGSRLLICFTCRSFSQRTMLPLATFVRSTLVFQPGIRLPAALLCRSRNSLPRCSRHPLPRAFRHFSSFKDNSSFQTDCCHIVDHPTPSSEVKLEESIAGTGGSDNVYVLVFTCNHCEHRTAKKFSKVNLNVVDAHFQFHDLPVELYDLRVE